MLNNHIWCVIMAGGSGTRFWPISTNEVPKQFVSVGDSGVTFLRNTFLRFGNLIPAERTIVVSNINHETLVRESLPELPPQNILLEPNKRDTAPCIAYAMYTILLRDPDAIMVVVPTDHMILNSEAFEKAVTSATDYVRENDVLMPIGIAATRPDTNYGYIQSVTEPQMGKPVAVKTFTEKPDIELARVFIQSGEFLWNSGIFVWKADTIRAEIERFLPQLTAQFKGWQGALGTKEEATFIAKAYAECQKISIDYAVMEKTSSAWVYPADFGWYDIGTWESMYSFYPEKDANGNACNTDSMLSECSGNLVLSTEKKKLMAICGLTGYAVIETDKVIMVCPRDDKKFRDFLSNLALPEYEKYR